MRRVCRMMMIAAVVVFANPLVAASYGKRDPAEHLFTGPVPHIRIEIPKEGMEVLRRYHQVWRQPRPERIDVRATVQEGGQVYTNVAVHLKGSFTFQPIDRKPSLTLNFDKFADGQRFHGMSKIHLNSSVQDPSYLCEQLARGLFNDIGVPAPRATPVRLTLNGREMGVYVLLEGADKQFLKRHFSSAKGSLFDGGAGGDIMKLIEAAPGEQPDDRAVLTTLLTAARQRDSAKRLALLKQHLDLDQFLSFVAAEVLIVHWDGYAMGGPNNYRIYHDPSSGKAIFMPHGLDQIWVPATPSTTITPHFSGVVARGLITTPEGRRLYFGRIESLATNEFRLEALHARVDRLAERLRPALRHDQEVLDEFENEVSNLKMRIARRSQIVSQRLKDPPQPLAFGPQNSASLSGWRFKTSNMQPASGRRTFADNRELLQVINRTPTMAGSWRTQVLLDQGRYVFTGKARTEGFPAADATGTNGVILRVSGERSPKGSASAEWTVLSYEFDVDGIEDVELVCEFRGRGSGFFDPASMRLSRKQ